MIVGGRGTEREKEFRRKFSGVNSNNTGIPKIWYSNSLRIEGITLHS